MLSFILWLIGFLSVYTWSEVSGTMAILFQSIVKTVQEFYDEQVQKGTIKPEEKEQYMRNSVALHCFIVQACRFYVAVTIYWIIKWIFNIIDSIDK